VKAGAAGATLASGIAVPLGAGAAEADGIGEATVSPMRRSCDCCGDGAPLWQPIALSPQTTPTPIWRTARIEVRAD
jgi:hypothetical protein